MVKENIRTKKERVSFMRVQIVGTKQSEGVFNGNKYDNTMLYCIEKDVTVEGLVGDRVKTIKAKTQVLPLDGVKVGQEYVIYFGEPRVNDKGQPSSDVEFIQLYRSPKN